MTVLPYRYETAAKAGKLTRDIDRPVTFADSAIAATAILNKSKLYTLNKKDFLNIPNLELV